MKKRNHNMCVFMSSILIPFFLFVSTFYSLMFAAFAYHVYHVECVCVRPEKCNKFDIKQSVYDTLRSETQCGRDPRNKNKNSDG